MVEKSLDIHGDEILYVGDHIFTDVSQSKVHLRWRTALICRELEYEVRLLTFLSSYRQNFVEHIMLLCCFLTRRIQGGSLSLFLELFADSVGDIFPFLFWMFLRNHTINIHFEIFLSLGTEKFNY
jgi:hypothetical protein